jgi:hypothetical protein
MEIINIIAIVVGPLFAVLITLWWQERKEKRDKKINLFTMLLAYRKSYPVSPEWARGLNVIDVVFQDHPRVLELWHQYYDMLMVQHPDEGQKTAQNHKYLELMSEIAKDLGFAKLQQTEIDKFYIPQAHADDANLNAAVRLEFLRVLQGSARFVVDPKPPEHK